MRSVSMNDRTWFEIKVTAAAEAAEAVEFGFNELDALGTEIDNLRKRPGDDVVVTGYFDVELPMADVEQAMHRAAEIYGLTPETIRSVKAATVEQTDWLAEWKKHWRPTFTERFIVAPPWETIADADGRMVIKIEPNMAFGTGTHETTRLCLRAVERLFKPGESFLDVGTGTGILAFAAALLSKENKAAGRIYACDTDVASVKIARENAVLNGVDDRIEFVEGELTPAAGIFDVTCANLTFDVIEPILPLLLRSSRRILILSGILVTQEQALLAAFTREGISEFSIDHDGEWLAAVVHRS